MLKDQAIFAFPQSLKLICDYLKRLAPGYYWFEIRRCREKRTLPQNAFFHGVWLPRIAKGLSDQWGYRVMPYEAKQIVKDEFLRVPVINKETGEETGQFITRGTSELDKTQFSEFMDKLFMWALDYLGTELPESDRNHDFRYERKPAKGAVA